MMNEPQFFAAPDGTEMVIITRARFDALLAAEEDMEDLAAAHEGAASIAAEGAIPLEVSNAIANGAHPITAWRKHRGLTQAQLADQTGFTQAAVARLEKADPGAGRPETVDAIARALDAPRWALEMSIAARPSARSGAQASGLAPGKDLIYFNSPVVSRETFDHALSTVGHLLKDPSENIDSPPPRVFNLFNVMTRGGLPHCSVLTRASDTGQLLNTGRAGEIGTGIKPKKKA